MENRVKKNSRYYFLLSLIMVFLCANFFSLAAQELISFDVGTPVTWYEKGLNSILYVWNKARSSMMDCVIKDKKPESFDPLFGRLAYAQFCIENMCQEKRQILDEDILYFYTVLNAIENTFIPSSDYYSDDYMKCLLYLLTVTKGRLIALYPNIIKP